MTGAFPVAENAAEYDANSGFPGTMSASEIGAGHASFPAR